MKELWCYQDNRISVRFEYEYHDHEGQWWRAHGNEVGIAVHLDPCMRFCQLTAAVNIMLSCTRCPLSYCLSMLLCYHHATVLPHTTCCHHVRCYTMLAHYLLTCSTGSSLMMATCHAETCLPMTTRLRRAKDGTSSHKAITGLVSQHQALASVEARSRSLCAAKCSQLLLCGC